MNSPQLLQPLSEGATVDGTAILIALITMVGTTIVAAVTQWLQGRKIHNLVNSQAQVAREVLAAAYEHVAALTRNPTDIQRAKDARRLAQGPAPVVAEVSVVPVMVAPIPPAAPVAPVAPAPVAPIAPPPPPAAPPATEGPPPNTPS